VADGLRSVFRGAVTVASTTEVIEQQEEHHRVKSFHEEFRALLAKYKIEGDERYLWS